MRRSFKTKLGVLACALALMGCEDPIDVATPGADTEAPAAAAPAATPTPAARPAPAPTAEAEPAEEEREDWEIAYDASTFEEAGVENRDPFRDFPPDAPVEDGPDRPEVNAKMGDTAVESMRVLALVTGVPRPVAMIADATGRGFPIYRGDVIGRGEQVRVGADQTVVLHWRVDRIYADRVVLERRDPTSPDAPPIERVLALYDEAGLAVDADEFAFATGSRGGIGIVRGGAGAPSGPSAGPATGGSPPILPTLPTAPRPRARSGSSAPTMASTPQAAPVLPFGIGGGTSATPGTSSSGSGAAPRLGSSSFDPDISD